MKIAFQGEFGAYMHMATMAMFPNAQPIPCRTFQDAFAAVQNGTTDRAMIAIDNTLAGRVADVHHLLPNSGLYICGEVFLPIRHCLIGTKGATIEGLKQVHSHVHAIPQCHQFFKDNKHIAPVIHADTAGAAKDVAKWNDPTQGAIASELAVEIYDLEILKINLQDRDSNTTRFIALSPEPVNIPVETPNPMTSLMFEVNHIPAALFHAMKNFADNDVNMMKLESYADEKFQAARFYCEIDGHVDHDNVKLSLDGLKTVVKDIKILGCYQQSDFRTG